MDEAADKPPTLLQVVRLTIRRRRYSPRTEESYVHWIWRFVSFHGRRHPREMDAADVRTFLDHLVRDRKVSPATQSQALSAILFLYREVLVQPLSWSGTIDRAKRPVRRPSLLSTDEVARILQQLEGTPRLVVELLYGAGLRVGEALNLRVHDIDFETKQLTVRLGKGAKDRVTMLPSAAIERLREHLERVRALHRQDIAMGLGDAPLPPYEMRRNHHGRREWGWQFVFPSRTLSRDPQTRRPMRNRLHERSIQRAIANAARRMRLGKRLTAHTFRHAFATHLLQSGYDIRTVQELLGHEDVTTTMMYTHVLDPLRGGVRSPLDAPIEFSQVEGPPRCESPLAIYWIDRQRTPAQRCSSVRSDSSTMRSSS